MGRSPPGQHDYGIYGHPLPTDAGEYRDAMSASRGAARERATGLGEVVALAGRRR